MTTTGVHDEFPLPVNVDGRGLFVVFEGADGSGKSTQAAILAERSGALLTRQPGATELGVELRRILLDGAAGDLSPRAEALLMAADRAQHTREVLEPTLGSGRAVVCDRYIASSVAYQGHGRGLDPAEVAEISEWATEGLRADVIIYLRVTSDESRVRLGPERDRIESAGSEFHQRVLESYEIQAAADPLRWVSVDGSGTVDEVADRVAGVLLERLDRG